MATTALAQRAPSRRFLSRYAGYVLVLPAVIYVLALVGFPLILGVWYSLTDVIVAVVSTFAKITLSVALAFLMLGAFPGRRIVRALFVLPWTVPIALSTISWKWMFHSQYSV